MRSFSYFLLLMAFALVAGALLAYPAYALGQALGADWAFHRVASRVAMLVLLLGFLWLLRRLDLADRASLGFAVPRHEFLRTFAIAWVIGVLSMLPVIAALLAFDVRDPAGAMDAARAAGAVLKGLIAGLVVASIEETFLRGAMHTAIERESGARAAIVLTALVYAAVHFLNRTRIPHDSVDWASGLALLSGTFSAWERPAASIDSFLALFAVGVLLGMVRARTGHIAACIGLHAGWVWIIAIARELTTRNPEAAWRSLVGSYDGLVGYLVLGWTIVMILAFRWLAPRLGARRIIRSS